MLFDSFCMGPMSVHQENLSDLAISASSSIVVVQISLESASKIIHGSLGLSSDLMSR